MDTDRHFAALFAPVVARFGKIDEETLSAIVGFSSGGPVSLCTISNRGLFITCELSLYKEQKRSSEGLKFELMYIGDLKEDLVHQLLTTLGNLSMNVTLGDGHTVDVSGVLEQASFKTVRLRLFSKSGRVWRRLGIYQVVVVA